MRELSLHILDIVQNSIRAGASQVNISLLEDTQRDVFEICVKDNGRGMEPEIAAQVTDPFFTTRQTRKVGLGLPLLRAAAEASDGHVAIESMVGVGTSVTAVFRHSHVDRMPLGGIVDTMCSLIISNPTVDFLYAHEVDGRRWALDTRELKDALELSNLAVPEVLTWIREFLNDGMRFIYEGV